MLLKCSLEIFGQTEHIALLKTETSNLKLEKIIRFFVLVALRR